MKQHIVESPLALMVLCMVICLGCSTTTPQADANIAPQERRLFEERKYRDPSLGTIPPSIRTKELTFARDLSASCAEILKGENVQALASFTNIGPWNIGGRTRGFVYDAWNPDVLYAAGVSGGLWKSHGKRWQWQLLTEPHELHNITSLVQDKRPGKGHLWYYGTGESYGNSARITGNGIWKSVDGAASFSVIPSTVSDRTPSGHAFAYSWRLVLDPSATQDVIYDATTRHGIWRSSDGGETWDNVLPSDAYFSDVVVTNTGVVYASLSSFTGFANQTASKYGVFRSTNGVDWVNISPPDLPKSFNRAVFGLVPNYDKFFLIAETPGSGTKGQFHLRTGVREEWHSLWKYEYLDGDGSGSGGRWLNRSANIPLMGGRSGDFFSQGGYDLMVTVSPHDSNLVLVGGTNLYRSTDAFRSSANNTWIGGYGLPNPSEAFPRWPNHHSDQHDAVFHPGLPHKVYSANDGGVMVTDNVLADTVVWESCNMGYLTTQHYAVSMRMDSVTDDVMGGMQDNGTWATDTNSGTAEWFYRNGGDGGYSYFADSGRSLYVSTQQGRLRRVVVDASGTEVQRGRIDPIGPSPDDYLFINPFAIDRSDERVLFQPAGSVIYRNNDVTQIPLGRDDSTSVNWEILTNSTVPSGQISAIAVSVQPAHILYYGTSNGAIFRMDGANVGQPVPKNVSPVQSTNSYLNALSVDPRDANKVIACYSNYGVVSIYATSDGGTSWLAVSGNLEEVPSGAGNGPAVNWVDVVPFSNDTDVWVAATSTGLYMTPELNGMSTVWMPIATESIGNVPVDMVVTRHADKRILVATHGRGVWTGSISSLPPRTGAPTLVSPPDLSRGIGSDTIVTWTAVPGAVFYRVEVSTTEDFSGGVVAYDGITETSFRITGLMPGPYRMYWRVTAFAGGGKGEPSPAWSFFTVIRPPVLIHPESRAENVPGLPVMLTWEKVPGAVSYEVNIGTNFAFGTLVDQARNVPDTTYGSRSLASGTRYFWRVRSSDADGTSPWSDRRQFVTGTLTSLSEDDWADAGYLQLSPNPATALITITGLAAELATTMYVVDSRGMVVHFTQMEPGVHSLSVTHLPVGSYTMRAEQGKQRYTAPFTVLR